MLPVSLMPTAMAGEMRNGWPHARPIEPGRGVSSARTVHSGETAEVIGQEQLPLEAALASARARSAPSSPSDWGPAANVEGASSLEPDVPGSPGDQDQPPLLPVNRDAPTEPSTVTIEVRVVPGRTGRPRKPEKFPFGALTPASRNEDGEPSGPCFFIPLEDNPERCVAAALKRHRPKRFITRRVPGGTWVWRRS
jgi:hypothetical protein